MNGCSYLPTHYSNQGEVDFDARGFGVVHLDFAESARRLFRYVADVDMNKFTERVMDVINKKKRRALEVELADEDISDLD